MFPELKDRAVWAGDGHHIEHACHAMRDSKGRHVSVNSLYLLCLHTGMMVNLAPVQGNGVYRNELPVFRKALPKFLDRQSGARGKASTIFLFDMAYIDNEFWGRARSVSNAGAVLISRMKENMNPSEGTERAFDRSDPVNEGVDGDLEIRFTNGVKMRLVVYTDPETGRCYQFLTTDFDLRPGVIAWLYLLRWRIEKVFDTSKNKLQETKAWANGQVAQQIQGHFLALTHNLLILFRCLLEDEHDLREEKVERKATTALRNREEIAAKKGCHLHPLTFKLPRIVQLTAQFIRSVRNHISRRTPLRLALASLAVMLIRYL
jgi:hypothetical protein